MHTLFTPLFLYLCFFIGFQTTVFCQSTLDLDSVYTIKQSTYTFRNNVSSLSIIKESVFDTNAILIRQDRYNYMKVDTGFAPRTHYHFTYNPKNRLGSYYTEQLTHSSKPNKKYSKQESKFRSYDHKFKREWLKLYKKNSNMLLRQTKKTFDKNGYVTRSERTNYDTSPSNSSTEKVERNVAGNIIFWESFDDDGDTKMQARSFEAKYKNDTLLLQSSGYLYHNWNQVINKYDRNNHLKKSISNIGVRGSNGKVKRTDQTIIIYKENRPFKKTEKKLRKKIKTTTYVFEEDKETQTIVTPDKTYNEVKTYTYLDSTHQFLIQYTETLEGKPFIKEEMEYDTATAQMIQHTEIEYRNNGKDWKTVKTYNNRGNYTKIEFFIANQLRKRDIYQYTYYLPKIEEKEED